MIKFCFYFCIFFSANNLLAGESFGNYSPLKVNSVYDADTFRVDLSGWPDVVGKNIPIRVLGVDAPEIRGKCEKEKIAAKKARQFTVDALNNARVIELRNIQRGKYFRLLADVFINNNNLASLLINAGHGRFYDGGKRDGWCG